MLERDMNSEVLSFISLSDDQLLTETKRLAACERSATAALLRSLVEVDSRRLYLREGCSSLFTYCTQVLHLSEGAAYNRIEAARAARRFPSVLTALEDGSLTLGSARLLAPHFTLENHDQLIAAARHKSKRDVELLVATLAPKHPAADGSETSAGEGRTCVRRHRFGVDLAACHFKPRIRVECGEADSARPCATDDGTPRQRTSATAALTGGPGALDTVVGCTLPPPGHDDARDARQASSSARPAATCRALR